MEAATLPSLILTRNLEMLDLMLGYEQARQMLLRAPDGRPLLAVAERPGSLFTAAVARQVMDSSRAFTIDVFDVASLQAHSAEPGRGACPVAPGAAAHRTVLQSHLRKPVMLWHVHAQPSVIRLC